MLDKKSWTSLLREAMQGDAEAQWKVGLYYEEGCIESDITIVPQDQDKAIAWYRKSAEQGYSSAQIALGNWLSTQGADADFESAIYWMKRAVESDHASAAHNLGTIYRDMGCYRKAFRWYKRAVDMGDLDSNLEVGLCLYFGLGVKQDPKAACSCFRKVTREDYPDISVRSREDAHYWLGVAYLEGRGVKQSVKKARKMFEIADVDLDHEPARDLLTLVGRSEYRKRV